MIIILAVCWEKNSFSVLNVVLTLQSIRAFRAIKKEIKARKQVSTNGSNECGNDLHFWKNGHHRHNDTKDEVEADEDFVFCAVIWLCVEYIEQNHSSKGTDILHQCEREQGCGKKHTSVNIFSQYSHFQGSMKQKSS